MGHSMVVWENSIILYGGCDHDGIIDDEKIYQYKIDYKMWSVINITGVKPGPRVYHCMGFFSKNVLFIFGGKYSKDKNNDYVISSDLFTIDLTDKNSMTTFVAGIAPAQRFGHKCATNFDIPELVIIGGLDNIYYSMDIYSIVQEELNNEKKWVYEEKSYGTPGNTQDEKDPIFEISKQAISTFKNQLEILEIKNLEINKKYADLFNMLNNYRKKELEENQNSNLLKTELKEKLFKLDQENKILDNENHQLEQYNFLYNQYLETLKTKNMLLCEYLNEVIEDILILDDVVTDVEKSDLKKMLFANVDIDSLVYKRKNFKAEIENFLYFFKDVSMVENDIYSEIKKHVRFYNLKQDDMQVKFKNYYIMKSEEDLNILDLDNIKL